MGRCLPTIRVRVVRILVVFFALFVRQDTSSIVVVVIGIARVCEAFVL